MSNIDVFIQDKIRKEQIRISINVDSPIDAVIEWYVNYYDLPIRNFDLSKIE